MGTIGTWLTTPTSQGQLGYTIGTLLTTLTNQGRLGYTIGTWLTTPTNHGRLGYTIGTRSFFKFFFLYNDISCEKRKENLKKSLNIFCSFFLDLSFLYDDISCRMQKNFKNLKLEKNHSAFFASFFFIYLYCKMIKAVKCKRKFQN